MNLKNQVVIVTGGKTGIGHATAARFAQEGARVIIADIQDANPEVLALKKMGADVHSIRVAVLSPLMADGLHNRSRMPDA
jgi:NAD(P)-dependent dehydrogenase (short-subunit alcohol dehydrogenase family)